MIPEALFEDRIPADNYVLDKDAKAAKDALAAEGAALNPPPQPGDGGIADRQGTTFVTEAPGPSPVADPYDINVDTQGDLIRRLNEIGAPPKPVYDADREKRLKTMASASGVAKALMTLGDAFALSKGGVVRPRQMQPDNVAQQILADKAVYKDKDYAYNVQQHADKLRQATAIAAAGDNDTRMKIEIERQKMVDARAANNTVLEAQHRDRMYELEKQQLEEAKRRNLAGEGLEADRIKASNTNSILDYNASVAGQVARAEQAQAKEDAKKPVISTPDGKVKVKLDNDDQLDDLYGVMMSDPAIQAKAAQDIQLMKGTMGGLTQAQMRSLVRKYWSESPAVQDYLQQDGKLQAAPQTTGQQAANSYMTNVLGVQPKGGSAPKAPSMFQ